MSAWCYQFQIDGKWFGTSDASKIPSDATAIGVGFKPDESLLTMHPEKGSRPFLDEHPEGYILGWTEGPFTPMCYVPKHHRGPLLLSTSIVPSAPELQTGWEPPIVSWRPFYNNGDSPQLQSYNEIDRSRLRGFSLIDYASRPVLFVSLQQSQRLIYRRRVSLRSDGAQTAYHLCGFQQNIAGRNYQAMCYAPESGVGGLIFAGRFREDNHLFNAVVIRPEERANAR